ncbi:hypothetical protein [Deinococcus sp. QL22]|uniref:hypothetical protein n=1 Tax=Deinococcus sp. QL22 TaxID=2939437 RepID=UPI002016D084|nr:hypothetical protein [Deinococcus sp. QL22]UQN05563.1 hypothetical protein M1R55_11850 [Deinococcus sp. QL22]
MKRVLLLLCAAAGLVACGGLASPPAPSAGDLLSAPTTLNLAGRTVKLDATPQLTQNTLNLRVRLQTTQKQLPKLKVMGVYMVTAGGVWNALPQEARACDARSRCTQVTASGPAQGLKAAAGVQVVVNLSSSDGRTYWLRDAVSSISQSGVGRDLQRILTVQSAINFSAQ